MKRVITFGSIVGFLSVTIFVATEIGVVAAATVWAISGLMHLGSATTIALGIAVAIPALYGIVQVAKMAFDAETDPANM